MLQQLHGCFRKGCQDQHFLSTFSGGKADLARQRGFPASWGAKQNNQFAACQPPTQHEIKLGDTSWLKYLRPRHRVRSRERCLLHHALLFFSSNQHGCNSPSCAPLVSRHILLKQSEITRLSLSTGKRNVQRSPDSTRNECFQCIIGITIYEIAEKIKPNNYTESRLYLKRRCQTNLYERDIITASYAALFLHTIHQLDTFL